MKPKTKKPKTTYKQEVRASIVPKTWIQELRNTRKSIKEVQRRIERCDRPKLVSVVISDKGHFQGAFSSIEAADALCAHLNSSPQGGPQGGATHRVVTEEIDRQESHLRYGHPVFTAVLDEKGIVIHIFSRTYIREEAEECAWYDEYFKWTGTASNEHDAIKSAQKAQRLTFKPNDPDKRFLRKFSTKK
jgi:hypothetical protein